MKKVVLVGSGHAHLEILKELTIEETAKHQFFLISPHRLTFYSALIPRLIAGEIEAPSLTIHSANYAERKGIRFLQDEVQSIDQKQRILNLKSGDRIQFDLVSINIGGTPFPIPTKAPLNTVYLRPFDAFLEKWREIQRTCSTCINPRFVIIGGGAAAVEVATALRIQLNKNQAEKSQVHLVSKGPRLCENYCPQISEKIRRSLLKNNIKVHLNEKVDHIDDKVVKLKHGDDLEFDTVFVVTPSLPARIISGKVDSKLQLSANIFASGDGTEMADHPLLPKSGVIAVHQGRHLAQSIRAALMGIEPSPFPVKARQLNILITGKDSARLVWGNFSIEGKWPLRMKNRIDQRYMASFSSAL
jgi:NADH dehydrogenase FAD-containing subunit